MTDYTTETVREDLTQTSSWRFMQHEIGPKFDRWLAERDNAVAEAAIREHAEAVAQTMRSEFQGTIVGLMAENTQLRGLLASVGGSLPQRVTIGEVS